MEVIPIGELKANFSTIIRRVKRGERIIVSSGKQKEKVAILSPYEPPKGPKERRLGLLKGKADITFRDDFKIGEEELISL